MRDPTQRSRPVDPSGASSSSVDSARGPGEAGPKGSGDGPCGWVTEGCDWGRTGMGAVEGRVGRDLRLPPLGVEWRPNARSGHAVPARRPRTPAHSTAAIPTARGPPMTRSLARLAPLALASLAATAGAHDHTRERAEQRLDAPPPGGGRTRGRRPARRAAPPPPPRPGRRPYRQLPARPVCRVTDPENGRPYALDPLDAIPRAHDWHAVPRGAAIQVPKARDCIEAFHGLETAIASTVADLSGSDAAARRTPLRFADTRSRGLRSGNTHLHLDAPDSRRGRTIPPRRAGRRRTRPRLPLHLRRAEPADRDYISNEFARKDLARLSAAGPVLYDNGEEHRHNFGAQGEGFGHVMLLGLDALIHPVSIGPGIMGGGTDFPPLRAGIKAAAARLGRHLVPQRFRPRGHPQLARSPARRPEHLRRRRTTAATRTRSIATSTSAWPSPSRPGPTGSSPTSRASTCRSRAS